MTQNFVPVLWIVWAVIIVVTAALYAYRTSLTRDEEGQIFLDDAFENQKAHQSQIVSRVNHVQPAVRVSLVLSAAVTTLVIGYYVWGAVKALVM